MFGCLSEPHFVDEEAAFAFAEDKIWKNGPVCGHCGGTRRITRVKANSAKRIRAGLWRCGDCRKQFTVKNGTSLHQAHVPMHKVLQAIYLLTGLDNEVTSAQLQRVLGINYKSARFLTGRIRKGFERGDLSIFEADSAPRIGTFGGPLFSKSLIANIVANERFVMRMFFGG